MECVGHGANGVVHRAVDRRTGESVAVKCPRATSPAARKRLEAEAGLLARLRHPSLPESHGVRSEAGEPRLLMRFVPGLDLGEQLACRGRPFGVRSVLDWTSDLLDALAYLHARGIVHHDVKPRNIKLDADGRAVLLDFGLAREMSSSRGTGSIGYTATYSPPEQLRGGRTDARSDLYALGATMYELLTRRSPAGALHRLTARANGQTDPLQPLDALNPAVPAGVAVIVHTAMALDPAGRPADARSMQAALAHRSGEIPDEHEAAPAVAHRLWLRRSVSEDDDTWSR
jgi:serine/threonine protein kinase